MGKAKTSRPIPGGLKPYWGRPLSEFVQLPPPPMDDGLEERHRLYSLLLMALVRSQMNGNKYGSSGDYGEWRLKQQVAQLPSGTYLYEGGSYFGHNIAALAVDANGRVIDFDFNHNELFNSSVEHAESRLIRRLFTLTDLMANYEARPAARPTNVRPSAAGRVNPPALGLKFAISRAPMAEAQATGGPSFSRQSYATMLTDVTVYTSLESCAQCSGIMCLADVREVAYLQYDNGQFYVGNIMYKATSSPKDPFRSPIPLPADAFGFEYYDRLNTANTSFASAVAKAPFFKGPTGVRNTPSITSFLCTDAALAIYDQATQEFLAVTKLSSPGYRRPARDGQVPETALTNDEVLTEVRQFRDYALAEGRRGTPHRV